jgi:hypothetical protein
MNDPGSADDRAPLAIDEWPCIQVADRLEDRIRRGEFGAEAPTLEAIARLAVPPDLGFARRISEMAGS